MKHFGFHIWHETRIWAVLFVAIFVASESRAYVMTNVPAVINAYSNAFYYVSGTNGYIRSQQGGSGATYFWQFANEIQSVEDAYQWTGNPVYLGMITNLLNGFLTANGSSWSYNGYNDDDLWAVMAFAMGAQLTGKAGYATVAKSNFDMVYARAWDSNLGGGLYWQYPNNASKNACVNGPGAIAAALLYQIYNDTNYWNKATNIYYWERATLYTTSSGRIADNIGTNGTVNGGPTTYNQGTFIGAADLLGLTNDAALTATYTMNSMSGSGYLPQYGIGGNNSIFNSILIRWLGRYMKNRGIQAPYQVWLQNQANAAWNGRRTADGLSWCQWPQQTPNSTNFYSYDCISSFEAMLAVPPTQTNVTTVVTLNQSDALGTSSFENGLNWSDGNAPSIASDYVVSGLTLRSPADGANHFFSGNSLTLSNSAVLAFKNSSGAGVSVGTDLFLDNAQLADWGGNSTTFYGHVTLRNGGGQIDPEANTLTMTALIGGTGSLQVQAQSLSVIGGTVVISGLNTYTGGTIINAADTIKLSGEGTLGASTGSLTFSNTVGYGYGAVNLNSFDLAIGNLSGAAGNIYNNSTNGSTLTVGNGNATGGTFAGTINSNIDLVKTGTGTLVLSGNNSYSGGTTVNGGILTAQNNNAFGTNGTVTMLTRNGGIQLQGGISLPAAVAFNLSNDGTTGTVPYALDSVSGNNWLNGPINLGTGGGGTVIQSDNGAFTLAGNISIAVGNSSRGIYLQGASTGSNTVSGLLSDLSGSSVFNVVKAGTGTWALTGANTYSGGTAVSNGMLLVNNTTGSGTGSGVVRVTGAGAVLGGTGSMIGPLTVAAGGTLAPGISARSGQPNVIGTLTVTGTASISGPVMMKLNRAASPGSDELVASSVTVNSGATLTVTNIGSTNLAAGDVFNLFNLPVTGTFSSVILPSLPAPTLVWTNLLAVNGTIAVVSTINTNSTNIVAIMSGGMLTLSWPQDHVGWTLQVQTNSLGAGLGGNWVDVSGSAATNIFTVPVVATNGAVFYRLKL